MSPREAREAVNRNAFAIVAALLSFVASYATLQAKVEQKADRSTVEAIAKDIRTIKLILCERAAADSYCKGTP